MLAIKRHPQIFDRSRLKDGYRGILDQAQADGAVLIRDQGEGNLVLVREDIFGAFETAHDEAQDFAQFAAAIEEAVGHQAPLRALSLGRLSWAAELGRESFRMFVTEYVSGYLRALHSGDWQPLRELLGAWRDTALVERDPELLAEILDLGDVGDGLDIGRPREVQTDVIDPI